MCVGGGAKKPPEQKKPDPIVKDEDQNSGGRAAAGRDRSKVAALYGDKSMLAAGGTGMQGAAVTAGRKVVGA